MTAPSSIVGGEPRHAAATATDWLLATGLVAGAFLVRVPFRSQLAYHWDGAQLALALDRFEPALGVPHLPGYILYVWLGRLARLVVGDPHASLVWISVIFGSALVGAIYLLGNSWFGRGAGLAAGLFALTSPQLWFHSEVALTYVVDGLLVCGLVGWGARVVAGGDGRWRDAVGLGLLLAVIGGVRQQTVLMLGPVVLYTFWRFPRGRRLAGLGVAAAVAVAGGLVWLVPVVRATGGWAVYRELVGRFARNNAPVTFAGGGWPALFENVTAVGVHCWNGLLLAAFLCLGALVYRVRGMDPAARQQWNSAHRGALTILAWWVVPMVLFGTVIAFTSQPGYVIGYLPALLILAGAAVGGLRRRAVALVLTALVVVANVVVFTAWPAAWAGALAGEGRTAPELRTHDAQLRAAIDAIRARGAPERTVICHAIAAHYWFGLRHFELHLPEFREVQLPRDPTVFCPDAAPLVGVADGRTTCVTAAAATADADLVLIVPPGLELRIFGRYFDLRRAEPLPGAGGTVYLLPAGAARR